MRKRVVGGRGWVEGKAGRHLESGDENNKFDDS